MKGPMHRAGRSSLRARHVAGALVTLSLLAAFLVAMPASGARSAWAGDQATSGLWDRVSGPQSSTGHGGKAYIRPERFRTFALDLSASRSRSPR